MSRLVLSFISLLLLAGCAETIYLDAQRNPMEPPLFAPKVFMQPGPQIEDKKIASYVQTYLRQKGVVWSPRLEAHYELTFFGKPFSYQVVEYEKQKHKITKEGKDFLQYEHNVPVSKTKTDYQFGMTLHELNHGQLGDEVWKASVTVSKHMWDAQAFTIVKRMAEKFDQEFHGQVPLQDPSQN